MKTTTQTVAKVIVEALRVEFTEDGVLKQLAILCEMFDNYTMEVEMAVENGDLQNTLQLRTRVDVAEELGTSLDKYVDKIHESIKRENKVLEEAEASKEQEAAFAKLVEATQEEIIITGSSENTEDIEKEPAQSIPEPKDIITFENFLASGEFTEDLSTHPSCVDDFETDKKSPGVIFTGGLYIEFNDKTPATCHTWELMLENGIYTSNNIEKLAKQLYEWGIEQDVLRK
jgi:hypothetical protein